MKEKIIKYSEITFLSIYILFSIGLLITQFKYTNVLKAIMLYSLILILIVLTFKFKNKLKKFVNTKKFFILCIVLGITTRILLLTLNYKEISIADYQEFFYNASSFCNTNTISDPTYVGLFPFLMPYMVLLGLFFKIAGIKYTSIVLLNIILDLFIPLFLYLTFKNKSIGKCASVLYLLNPIALIWCTVCCPVTLVNFGISLSILIFSILLKNIDSKKYILFSILTGIIMAISNSFRPIMTIMLIAIFLYYMYINIKNKKFKLNYLISFLLILISFWASKTGIYLMMNKINSVPVSRTSGWTLYIGSNVNSNGMWYSEPKLNELLKNGQSVEEIQREFKQLAIERYKSNGINNIKLFANKFVVLTGDVSNYTFSTFLNTVNIHPEFLFRIISILLYSYVFASILLNILIAIQSLISRKNIELNIFYMLFYIGIIMAHLFVEVSPRYYMPALIPLCIINSISIYQNIKSNMKGSENNDKSINNIWYKARSYKNGTINQRIKIKEGN